MNEMRYGSVSARTECPHCGLPLPLSSPALATSCGHCLNEVDVPENVWVALVDAVSEKVDLLEAGQSERVTANAAGFDLNYEFDASRPRCEKCAEPFEVESLPQGEAQVFCCKKCGDPAIRQPAPEWLVDKVDTVRQIYCVDPPPESHGQELTVENQARPVALNCPGCGAGLKATCDSKRIMPCEFCQTDVFLPNDVWRQLHPVKTVTPLYLHFEGPSRRERKEHEEALAGAARRKARKENAEACALEAVRLNARAQRAVALLWLSVIGTLALLFTQVLPERAASTPFVVMASFTGLMILVAIGRSSTLITVSSGESSFFYTWFWLLFCVLFPGIGGLFALGRVLFLSIDRLDAAARPPGGYITTDRQPVHAGKPAALAFLAIALLQGGLVITLNVLG